MIKSIFNTYTKHLIIRSLQSQHWYGL
jgi:hypothetical protein